jgi:hypothetical protein
MKSLATLQLAVLEDLGRYFATDVRKDAETLLRRTEHEGESFLTITLPSFGKSLEQGLAEGKWPDQGFLGFKRVRGLPAFMRGFLIRVFDERGFILDDPDADAVWGIRQVCYLTGKMDRTCTPEREADALRSFIQTDRELAAHFRTGVSPDDWEAFERRFLQLFGEILDKIETKVSSFELLPRFGSGAVAEGLPRSQRWDFPEWPDRLDSVLPKWRYSRNLPFWDTETTVALGAERPVRVITVPKTQAKPRVIAIEPSIMQFAQQGLKNELYHEIETSPLREILGFTDQTRNQRLAQVASITGELATLDLSEASDRVHLSVVLHAFKKWPHTLDYILACRSRTADVNGEVVHLHKFASMGSALTFPIEAMVFTTLASLGMTQQSRIRPNQLIGSLSVYGDDIVVPVSAVADVVRYLEAFGFKVNKRKSFWTGKFRESCGDEYFDGSDVSVIRLRADVPTSRRDAVLVRRFVKFRNRAYTHGLWALTKACDDILADVLHIPVRSFRDELEAPSDVLSRVTFTHVPWRAVFDSNLQNWVERFPKVHSKSSPDVSDGEGGLLRWFTENHDTGQHQPDPYESQERAHTFRIKWAKAVRLPKRTELDEK